MPTVETDDTTEIFYEFDESAGDASVVVFLNGMTQSTEHWKRQVRLFREAFRVLTYDARGQGETDIGDTPLTMERHVADLEAVFDAVDVESAYVVGFSHGARIALGFAAARPARVEKLVLTSATAAPTALARTIVRSWEATLRHGGLEAMSWAALPAILGDAYLEENEAILEGIVRASIRRNSEEGVRRLLEAMADYPEPSELAGEISAPTFVLSASEDLLVEREGAAELAHLAGGMHYEIPGVGHTIPIEAPETFHRHVAKFLSG